MATFTEEVRPLLTPAEATQLLEDHYAKVGAVRRVLPLPSYDDQNWKVIVQCSQEAIDKIYVLKIAASGAACRGHAGPEATKASLDCEHTMMGAVRTTGVRAPDVRASDGGEAVVQFSWKSLTCFARVITWVDGVPLSECRGQANGALDRALGQVMGATDVALQHFEPRSDGADSTDRILAWDLANVSRVSRPYLNELFDEEVKARVTQALDAFDAFLASPPYALLPRQLIHGDANDENILVDEDGVRPGLVDFGDFVRSCRIFDLAILLAYALFDGKGSSMTSLLADSVLDPSETMLILQRACTIVAAYHSVCPLTRPEIDALYVLIRARNCQTILNAAHHFRLDPDPYKLVSAEPAKRLLRQLEQWDAATFSDALRAACSVK
jgi:Ser/Thr protein kinase RdoA (MazF antagonist)